MFRWIVIFVLGLALTACAWSYKEHVQITRIAAMRILDDPQAPGELKDWLRSSVATLPSMEAERDFLLHASIGRTPDPTQLKGVLWWVCVPDIEAENKEGPKVQPFGQRERLMHFVDAELFLASSEVKSYRHDLSGKPAFELFPRDASDERYVQAGYLPFATEHGYQQLVRSIRDRRLAPAREGDVDHAQRWAGYLAHYAQDATQPHHATMDFKSASYFPSVRNPPNVHAAMEWQLVDDPNQPLKELRGEFFLAVTALLVIHVEANDMSDVWESSLRTSLDAYDALPLIGSAAQSAAVTQADGSVVLDIEKFYRHRGQVRSMSLTVVQMKAMQTALAIRRTERLLRQAWRDGQR
jgi:hypothetical protein